MTRDGFDWFSIVASILGFTTVIQLCRVVWNRAVYVVSFILGSAAFGLIGFPGILPTSVPYRCKNTSIQGSGSVNKKPSGHCPLHIESKDHSRRAVSNNMRGS